jgi:Transposase DDE domain
MLAEGSQTRRSSPSGWPRRSWASRPIAAFLGVAQKRLSHLFPQLPKQPGYHKRRRRLADTIDWLTGIFAQESPGYWDDIVLVDSTPVECGRSVEPPAGRSWPTPAATATAAPTPVSSGACACTAPSPPTAHHGRSPSSPRTGPNEKSPASCSPEPSGAAEAVICDKGYAGQEFERAVGELGAAVLRPARKDEPDNGLHLSSIRQRIESVFHTFKDILTLERHGARTLSGLRARIAQRILALAACVYINHWLGLPSRSLVAYVA